jgi:hypothetical protein
MSITSRSCEMVAPGDWLVNSIWFLLSTGQVAVGIWGNSLPVHSRWLDLMLFLPGSSCVALQLQFCLVSSSPRKVEQFSFECSPQSHENSSRVPHGPALGGWLVVPPLLSAFVTFPAFVHWELGSLPHLHFLGQVPGSTPPLLSVLDYNSLFMFFSFIGGRSSICPGAVLDYVPRSG